MIQVIKKIFYIFFIVIILALYSCEDQSVPVIYDFRDTDPAESDEYKEETEIKIEIEITTETADITETDEIDETEETFPEKELIYDALYTVNEIKDMFNRDKESFEQIKDIKMPDGYNYFIAKNYPCKIEFYDFLDNNGAISYDIDENSEYKLILDFFNKYENIYFIHAINPDIDENNDIIAIFRIQMNLPGVDSEYIPWGEIRYNRNIGETEEKITGEYMIIPLDDHWYYIYSNIGSL